MALDLILHVGSRNLTMPEYGQANNREFSQCDNYVHEGS